VTVDQVDRDAQYQRLQAALVVAFKLSRRAVRAGLVVTQLAPQRCHGGYGCFTIQLWQSDGGLWAEGSHEAEEQVREHIRRYAAARQRLRRWRL
jgi:hypothetical protein